MTTTDMRTRLEDLNAAIADLESQPDSEIVRGALHAYTTKAAALEVAIAKQGVATMKYQVADLNNGPFGDEFDTPEAAEEDRQRCIEEGIEADVRAGEATRESARASAEEFFQVVEVSEGGEA